MKLEEALVEFRKGKDIRFRDEIIYHDKFVKWCFGLTMDAIISDDWHVVEKPGKTFPEVFEAFKEGKRIRRKEWRIGNYIKYEYDLNPITGVDLSSNDWEVID